MTHMEHSLPVLSVALRDRHDHDGCEREGGYR